jgi:hypothetical protein
MSELSLLAHGLVDPTGTTPFNPALRGEEGATLMMWLVDGGAVAPVFDDARTVFADYADKHLHEVGWPTLLGELRTACYMRGYDGLPRVLTFLHEGLNRVKNQADWDAWLAYLNWLTQVTLLRGTPDPKYVANE